MASQRDKQELVRKVSDLVGRRYGGNYEAAFRDYGGRKGDNKTVDREELMELLYDADVGNRITRGMWADGVIKEVDRDGDGKISYSEFEAVIRG
jgi:Ca2+-binding EF-hand superfamily protein